MAERLIQWRARLGAAVVALLLVYLAWSYYRLGESRRGAVLAEENLTACRELAQKIAAVQAQPVRAATTARTSQDLIQLISNACKSANFSESLIGVVDPQPPRRVADGDYLEQVTDVDLRSIGLAPLVTFLHRIMAENEEIKVDGLRLTASRQPAAAGSDELWSAEVTLTNLIFAPKR